MKFYNLLVICYPAILLRKILSLPVFSFIYIIVLCSSPLWMPCTNRLVPMVYKQNNTMIHIQIRICITVVLYVYTHTYVIEVHSCKEGAEAAQAIRCLEYKK